MAILGIVGGIAPPSTIAYYRAVLAAYERATGRSLRVIVDSIDSEAFYALLRADDRDTIVRVLSLELERVAAAGADLGLIASNTGHIGFDRVVAASPIPLVGIVDAVADALRGTRRVGLFATTYTIRADVYGSTLAARGMECVLPSDVEQERIQSIYFGELVRDEFRPESRAELLGIARRLHDEQGVEAIVLGGTELPLLLADPADDGIRLVDSGRLHAEAAIARLLEIEAAQTPA
jgi:aspartate racemase